MSNSLTLLPNTSHVANKTGAVVAFNAVNKTLVTSDTGIIAFSDFTDGDIVVITGSGSNDGTYTVSGTSTATTMTVLEDVTTEVEGATIVVDYQGTIGTKQKADGYYGYTDGLHTAAYTLNAFVGTVKIQGTLVKEPTVSDWFDITSTTATYATAETSTTGYNFTGNFVWVRAVVNGMTEGSVTKVLYNF
jgi:hypothetical protein